MAIILIFGVVWLLSPIALIPLVIIKTQKCRELEAFVARLRSCGRINETEFQTRTVAGETLWNIPPVFSEQKQAGRGENTSAPAAVPYEYGNRSVRTAAPVQPAAAVQPAMPAQPAVPAQPAMPVQQRTQPARKPEIRKAENKRAGAMSVLMMIGIIFVVLAGLIFSTAVWVNLGNLGRAAAVGIVTALFFGLSAFFGKKLKLENTSFAFYTLGAFFSGITLITAGYFGLLGQYLSVNGEGSLILCALALIIVSLICAKGADIFSKPAAAFISAFSAALSVILIMAELAYDISGFALIAALVTAAADIAVFAAGLKIPEKWNKPVKISAVALDAAALLSGGAAFIGGGGLFTAAAVVFALRAVIAAVMAFRGHSFYGKTVCAAVSLSAGGFFALAAAYDVLSGGAFALFAAISGILFAAVFFVLKTDVPENWDIPVKIAAAAFNSFGVMTALANLGRSFGSWDAVCYGAAAAYILSAFAAAALAAKGHDIYGSIPSAFSSLFTGTLFSMMMIFELTGSAASAAVCLTAMLLAYVNAVFTAPAKLPDGWKLAAYISGGILGAVSVCVTLFTLGVSCSDGWNAACYAAAALYIVQAAVIAIAAFKGHGEYGKTVWSVISAVFFNVFSLMLFGEISGSELQFMLMLAVFAAVQLNAVFTFKYRKPDGWKNTLSISAAAMGISGAVFASVILLSREFRTYHCYIAAAIFIAYSAMTAFMAFNGHFEYKKTRWAYASQITGISFSLMLLHSLAPDIKLFTLFVTVFGIVYLHLANTLKLTKPADWKTALDIFPMAVTALGGMMTLCGFMEVFVNEPFPSETNMPETSAAWLFVINSVIISALAIRGHEEYKKTRFAVFSTASGIITAVLLGLKALDLEETGIILFLALFGLAFTLLAGYISKKIPQGWSRTVKISDIALNDLSALFALIVLIGNNGSWNGLCCITAAVYILYTAVRGIRENNIFLKAAQPVISCFAAYNLSCFVFEGMANRPELIDISFAAEIFAVAVIHRYAKPLRTFFSDIFLNVVLLVSAFVCAYADTDIFAVAAFGLLTVSMLLFALEKDGKFAKAFGVLMPLPVSGTVITAANLIFSGTDGLVYISAAAAAIVLTVIAAAVQHSGKRSGMIFYSFAITACLMALSATGSADTAVLAAVILSAAALTALLCRSENNLPAILSMADAAAAFGSIQALTEEVTGASVGIVFAAIFAAVSLAASRIFYGRRLFEKTEKKIALDPCCSSILMALPMINSYGAKTTAFAVLTLLAVFAANLWRREHGDDLNRAALTAGAALFDTALIFRPFLTVDDRLFSCKANLLLISIFGFVFARLWKKYPRLSDNFSSAVYSVCFICLIIDALTYQTLANTLIVLGISLGVLLISFVLKKKRWFAVSSVSLTGLTLYTFRDFFLSVDWWIYLLIAGLILIAVSSANEYFVKKGRELKEKAGRFFEDWSW